MPYETIVFEVIGPIARITMDRPQRANAMSAKMLTEIAQAMDEAEQLEPVRVIIITGRGAAFSSGFDLKDQMERQPSGVKDWRPILRKDFDVPMRFWHSPKPTIAAVAGPCLAGACELALACDITIAADSAFFGEPELKFGAGVVVMILPWIVGPKVAKEIILTGMDRLDATRAREIGMVNRVVPADALQEEALSLARHIAVIDPHLVMQTKRAINRAIKTRGMLDALESALDIDLLIEAEGSPDKRQFMDIGRAEGLKAALAWRDARFQRGQV